MQNTNLGLACLQETDKNGKEHIESRQSPVKAMAGFGLHSMIRLKQRRRAARVCPSLSFLNFHWRLKHPDANRMRKCHLVARGSVNSILVAYLDCTQPNALIPSSEPYGLSILAVLVRAACRQARYDALSSCTQRNAPHDDRGYVEFQKSQKRRMSPGM